jgi:hypothetical protein
VASVEWTYRPRPIAIAFLYDDSHASRTDGVEAALHRASQPYDHSGGGCRQLGSWQYFSSVHLHKPATQPPTALIQSDVDENNITITDANKTCLMHREFSGRRVFSPLMRDDQHCDAQMAQRNLTSASFGFSSSTRPGYKNTITANYHRPVGTSTFKDSHSHRCGAVHTGTFPAHTRLTPT